MARSSSTSSQPEEVLEPDSSAVIRRLGELGIPHEACLDSVRVGHELGDFTTAAHPRTYPGMKVWGEINGSFRTAMAALGWQFDDADGIPRVVSPDGQVTVVAVSGNAQTGIRNAHEQLSTRRPRGRASARIIRMNLQYMLQLADETEGARGEVVEDLGGTWFLLYHRDGDVIRSELSFAKSVSASGKLLEWAERLILPDIDLLEPPKGLRTDDSTPPDVDVPVSLRAS